MKLSVYVFGNFSSGYCQYPDDYTNQIFTSFYENAKANTQIAIHRRDDIMYYSYIRKLENTNYIGFCVLMNGIMLSSVNALFPAFENVFTGLVSKGHFVHFNEQGEIVTKVKYLFNNQDEIKELSNALEVIFEKFEYNSLPPLNYSIAKDSIKNFIVEDSDSDIVKASSMYGYTYIYKSKDYDTEILQSYAGVVKQLKQKNEGLQNDIAHLNSELTIARNAQRNMKYVSVLAFIVIVFGIILWNKVLYPSEVTKKDMGEYVYYGPMVDGEPTGVGVAIYKEDDKNQRLYYYGHFFHGERIDNNAIMFYKDGSYFKGKMIEDKWDNGIFFDADSQCFIGDYQNNEPYTGTWYRLDIVQKLLYGRSLQN